MDEVETFSFIDVVAMLWENTSQIRSDTVVNFAEKYHSVLGDAQIRRHIYITQSSAAVAQVDFKPQRNLFLRSV